MKKKNMMIILLLTLFCLGISIFSYNTYNQKKYLLFEKRFNEESLALKNNDSNFNEYIEAIDNVNTVFAENNKTFLYTDNTDFKNLEKSNNKYRDSINNIENLNCPKEYRENLYQVINNYEDILDARLEITNNFKTSKTIDMKEIYNKKVVNNEKLISKISEDF